MTIEKGAQECAKYNRVMPQDMMTSKWQQGRYEGFKEGAEWMFKNALIAMDVIFAQHPEITIDDWYRDSKNLFQGKVEFEKLMLGK